MKLLLVLALCCASALGRPDDLIKLDVEGVPTTVTDHSHDHDHDHSHDQDHSHDDHSHDHDVHENADHEDVHAVAAGATTHEAKKATNQGTVADRTKLVADLFKDYNSKVNPDHVVLKFGLSLIDFHVCDKRSVVDGYVWLKYSWSDERLKWNPAEHGGVDLIRIDADQVWKPDVTLYNSADPVNMINCWHSNVLVYSTGAVLWVPPCKMTSQCHFTLKKHPFGEQHCSMKFGSWTFDGDVLDIQFYNNTAEIDTSEISNTSGFDVVSTSGERHVKHYACCVEPYPDLTFNMTIKRTPAEELFHNM